MKTKTIEIDLNKFSKEELIFLINMAHSKDITFNECIVYIIKRALNEFETIERVRAERAAANIEE
jgi:hypothetical protein